MKLNMINNVIRSMTRSAKLNTTPNVKPSMKLNMINNAKRNMTNNAKPSKFLRKIRAITIKAIVFFTPIRLQTLATKYSVKGGIFLHRARDITNANTLRIVLC